MRSASWAADYAEAQQQKRLDRERAFNQALERINPCLRPTPRYCEQPLPSSSFMTREARLKYETARQMSKYNPTIVYPTAPTCCGPCGSMRLPRCHRKLSENHSLNLTY
jgi:hypothetical protein